ncbi:MAG: DUF6029 family protein [Candidatus Amulumruptor caecigallinarius]|nr:DUF6029 family protein [Candidatus Amulumruptor caecigallinarius]
MKTHSLFSLALTGATLMAVSNSARADYPVAVHGSVQADIVFPEVDNDINTGTYDHKILFNTYADVNLASKFVDAGLRAEFMKWPLPGYDPDFAGWGLSNFYVKGKYKGFELTAGDFYEQFGSGFILRTYEERALGIDNSIRGGRLGVTAIDGVKLTVLGGVQRTYWDWSKHSQVYGADAEVHFEQWMNALKEHNAGWMLGASYVLKHEDETEKTLSGTNYRLNMPKLVNAFDVRTTFNKGGWSVLGEFAWKGQDPSYDNDFTYGKGTAYMLSGTYSKRGMSAMLQAKRSFNMAYRSQRERSDLAAFINNMPAFTYTHTYSLPALYPYATQNAPGEWAFQGQFSYNFARKTPLGGRYGTKLTINASYVSSLCNTPSPVGINGTPWGTNGSSAPFFKMGACNYYDINVQVEKRFSAPFQMTFMYMNQLYNNYVGKIAETPEKYIRTNILVADAKYKFNKKYTLRGELQYLFTKQDQKDWAYGLVEFSLAPYLMISASDMWNCGDTGLHYYMFGITGNYKSNRLMLSYGRTRQGFNCSGGVCREVPAMHGFQINYSYNF